MSGAKPAELADAHDSVGRLLMLLDGETATPVKYVRLALKYSISGEGREQTVGRYARGIPAKWIAEGFPPSVKPGAIGGRPAYQAGPTNQPDPARSALEKAQKDRDAAKAQAAEAAQSARWDLLADDQKKAIEAAVRETHPFIRKFPNMIMAYCMDEMDRRAGLPGAG